MTETEAMKTVFEDSTMEEIEHAAIMFRLRFHNWNQSATARSLKISPRTLRFKIHRYRKQGSEIPSFRTAYDGPSAGE